MYYAQQAASSADDAQTILIRTSELLDVIKFTVDFVTGELIYNQSEAYNFTVNETTGNLEWEVINC